MRLRWRYALGPPREDRDDGSPDWSKWMQDRIDAERELVYDHPDENPRDRFAEKDASLR